MSSYLKGNFEAKGDVESPSNKVDSASDDFEEAALRRLGGSIAYVSRKKFLWQGEDEGSDDASKDNA